jgi:hypothetical protein
MDLLKQIDFGYFVTSKGEVISKYGELMTPQKHTGGYLTLNLWDDINKKHVTRYIHRLVAIAFLDNPENKKCVNHKNGNKEDNRVENLEWATYKENQNHAYDNNLAKSGEACTSSKLTLKQVKEIRARYKKGVITYVELGEIYGVKKQQIERIINNKRWKRAV